MSPGEERHRLTLPQRPEFWFNGPPCEEMENTLGPPTYAVHMHHGTSIGSRPPVVPEMKEEKVTPPTEGWRRITKLEDKAPLPIPSTASDHNLLPKVFSGQFGRTAPLFCSSYGDQRSSPCA